MTERDSRSGFLMKTFFSKEISLAKYIANVIKNPDLETAGYDLSNGIKRGAKSRVVPKVEKMMSLRRADNIFLHNKGDDCFQERDR